MTTLRLFVAVFLAELLCVGPALSAVGSWNGVAFTAWNGVAQTSWNGTAISCAGGLAQFDDDFMRGNETPITTPWTDISDTPGSVNLTSNEANAPITFGNENRAAVYSATACTTVSQYVKVTFTATNGVNVKPGVIFRFTNTSSAFYELWWSGIDQAVVLLRFANSDDTTPTQVGGKGLTFTFPLTIGATLIGTGTGTTARFWVAPTANAPDAGGTTWDSNAPTDSIIDDPASPVDTGAYVGIGGLGSSSALGWGNFFAGDVP